MYLTRRIVFRIPHIDVVPIGIEHDWQMPTVIPLDISRILQRLFITPIRVFGGALGFNDG